MKVGGWAIPVMWYGCITVVRRGGAIGGEGLGLGVVKAAANEGPL